MALKVMCKVKHEVLGENDKNDVTHFSYIIIMF